MHRWFVGVFRLFLLTFIGLLHGNLGQFCAAPYVINDEFGLALTRETDLVSSGNIVPEKHLEYTLGTNEKVWSNLNVLRIGKLWDKSSSDSAKEIQGALSKLMYLKPEGNHKKEQVYFNVQSWKKVFPKSIVHENKNGLIIDESVLQPWLVKAIQEQQQILLKQAQELKGQENLITKLSKDLYQQKESFKKRETLFVKKNNELIKKISLNDQKLEKLSKQFKQLLEQINSQQINKTE